MRIELPDVIVKRAEANAGDVLLALALQFYSDNRLDYDDALQLAAVTSDVFNHELLAHGISIHAYPPISARRAG